jgi:hypothetical protein
LFTSAMDVLPVLAIRAMNLLLPAIESACAYAV